MARTTPDAVKGILLNDYDSVNMPLITGFIDSASVIISRVIECATRKGITITPEEAEIMERWLAAYLYTQSDATYKSRQTLRASGTFNKTEDSYLNAAYGVDPSGCLKNAMTNNRVRALWMGKPPSAQIDYINRN